ncbi:hypothetical protein MRX96_000394 [Rhipicephalus microplus]
MTAAPSISISKFRRLPAALRARHQHPRDHNDCPSAGRPQHMIPIRHLARFTDDATVAADSEAFVTSARVSVLPSFDATEWRVVLTRDVNAAAMRTAPYAAPRQTRERVPDTANPLPPQRRDSAAALPSSAALHLNRK